MLELELYFFACVLSLVEFLVHRGTVRQFFLRAQLHGKGGGGRVSVIGPSRCGARHVDLGFSVSDAASDDTDEQIQNHKT